HAPSRIQPDRGASAAIGYCAATGDESLAHLFMPETQLQIIFGSEPISCPSVHTLALPPNPTTNQISTIGVPAHKTVVPIEKSVRQTRPYTWRIGINPLRAKIQLRNFWDARHIDAAYNGCLVPAAPRANLVIREGIPIKREPISQLRDPVSKIKTAPAITRIARGSGGCHASDGKNRLAELVKRHGYARTGKYRSDAHPYFEIWCRLETYFPAVDEGLIVQWLRPGAGEPSKIAEYPILSAEPSQEKLDTHWTQIMQNARQSEWAHSINLEHLDRGRIIAKQH